MEKQIVAKLVEDIAANFKLQAKAQYINYRNDQIAKHHIGDGKYILPHPKASNHYSQKQAAQRIREINHLLKSTSERIAESPVDLGYEYSIFSYSGIMVYVLVDDFDAKLDAEATKYANEVVENWKFKQIEKYNEVVDSKKGVKGTVAKFGNLNNNEICFKWEDGSGFTVQNQVTYCVSTLGTFFNRFPTTFHNVTLVGGEKMKQPSEAKVKKAFCNAEVAAKATNAPAVHLEVDSYYHKGKKVASCQSGSRMAEQRYLYGNATATADHSKVTCKRCLKALEAAKAAADKKAEKEAKEQARFEKNATRKPKFYYGVRGKVQFGPHYDSSATTLKEVLASIDRCAAAGYPLEISEGAAAEIERRTK